MHSYCICMYKQEISPALYTRRMSYFKKCLRITLPNSISPPSSCFPGSSLASNQSPYVNRVWSNIYQKRRDVRLRHALIYPVSHDTPRLWNILPSLALLTMCSHIHLLLIIFCRFGAVLWKAFWEFVFFPPRSPLHFFLVVNNAISSRAPPTVKKRFMKITPRLMSESLECLGLPRHFGILC